MINRRSFIKRILGIMALPVIGIAKVLKSEPDKQRTVWYGKADCDYLKGWNAYYNGTRWPDPWNYEKGVICVKAIEPIKKDQHLVWYPDGTIRGSTKG